MVNYPLGDFLIRLSNAAMAKNKEFYSFLGKKSMAVAISLQKLGLIDKIEKTKTDQKTSRGYTISLSFKSKKPKLMGLKIVSKPGLRVYMNVTDLEKKKGPSVYLLSTPKGILSSREAIKARVGGEVLAKIL